MAFYHQTATDLIPSRLSHAQLINLCLLPKITAQLNGGTWRFPFVNEADIYSKPPEQLVAEHAPSPAADCGEGSEWYFFTRLRYKSLLKQKRWSRMVAGAGGMARWHSDEGKEKKGKVEGTDGGYLCRFCYKAKTESGNWERSGWLMVEYSWRGIDGRDMDTVLCKLHWSPQKSARQQAPFGAAVEQQGTTTLGGEPPRLAPGAEGHSAPPPPPVGIHSIQEAERFLMADDAMPIPQYDYERRDGFYESYLLGGGGGGGEEADDMTAEPCLDAAAAAAASSATNWTWHGLLGLGDTRARWPDSDMHPVVGETGWLSAAPPHALPWSSNAAARVASAQQVSTQQLPHGPAYAVSLANQAVHSHLHGRQPAAIAAPGDDVLAPLAERGYVDEWLGTSSVVYGECSVLPSNELDLPTTSSSTLHLPAAASPALPYDEADQLDVILSSFGEW